MDSPALGPNATIYPSQISLYTHNGYSEWVQTPAGVPYSAIDMNSSIDTVPSQSVPVIDARPLFGSRFVS